MVVCYGGPHVQFVPDSWALTADLRAQFLREQGFFVLKVLLAPPWPWLL